MRKIALIISVYYENKIAGCGVKNLQITANGRFQNKNCVNNLSFMGKRGGFQIVVLIISGYANTIGQPV